MIYLHYLEQMRWHEQNAIISNIHCYQIVSNFASCTTLYLWTLNIPGCNISLLHISYIIFTYCHFSRYGHYWMHTETEAQDLDCLRIKLGELKEELPFSKHFGAFQSCTLSYCCCNCHYHTFRHLYFVHTLT